MQRNEELKHLFEYDRTRHFIIEPEKRLSIVRERLLDVINTYNPEIIAKAGIGSGTLLLDIAAATASHIVVVEPSLNIINDFLAANKGNPALEKIKLVNGDFNNLPIDYYSAKLLIAVDVLDMIESGKAIDEFRRALDFEGILFIGEVVLNPEDLEGIYDDYMRLVLPLHNDFYMEDDLKTVLDLNDFTFIKGHRDEFDSDVAAVREYARGLYESTTEAERFFENNIETFKKLYGFDGTKIREPYFLGVFMRRKLRAPGV